MELQSHIVPICIRGRYFWRGDSRFFVRGVVYQVTRTLDPISDDRLPQVKRDIQLFKELGLNTLFVYSIDHTKTHDQTMELLGEAGIYVLLTVASPSSGIRRYDPENSYNVTTMTTFFKVTDVMAKYRNTMGLLVAAELINDVPSIAATPFLRAAVRDLKTYIKLRNDSSGQRVLPIGYAAGQNDRSSLFDLSLGDSSSSIDFWTCNDYSWVGDASMAISGWNSLLDQVASATIPMLLSEYGSTIPEYSGDAHHQPRVFQETKALYSAPMNQTFSGGCVYEFWQARNDFGLVEMLPLGTDSRLSAHRAASDRANDQSKVLEKRESNEGTLLIYHDFANYKASLEATRDVESTWNHNQAHASTRPEDTDITPGHHSQERRWEVPETCVDWGQFRQNMKTTTWQSDLTVGIGKS